MLAIARLRAFGAAAIGIFATLGTSSAVGQGARAPETVVTATRLPTPVDRIGSAITVITEEQIRERQITSVADVLRAVPGISMSRLGGAGTQTQVRIRGAEANQTLVLIDGVEVNDPSGGSEFDFGHLLASGIERIEVLRGPQSALYGSDAIGGVVNIITTRGSGKPSGYASLEGGSFQTGRVDAGVSGGTEKVSYSFYTTGYHTDGISIASRKRGFDESDGYAQQIAGGKIGLTPTEPLHLDFIGRWSQSRLELDSFSSTTSPNIAIDSRDDTFVWHRLGRAQATLDMFGGAWQHIAGAGIADSRRDFRSDKVDTSRFDGLKRKVDYQSNLLYASEALVPAVHSTVFGLERETERVISASAFSDVNRTVSTSSVFAQQGITLWDALTVTAAGRHDWNGLFADETTWRVSGAYLFRESGTKLKASYGTGVKAPTLFELFGFTSTFQGNPDLVPERAHGFDAGIEQTLLGGRAAIELTYFANRIEGLIEGFGSTARNLPGEARADGIELSGRYGLLDALDLVASYTFTDTRDADGSALVRRPRHVGSVVATYRFLEKRATATLGVDYNGDRRDLVFFPFPQPTQRFLFDDYTLVRLTGSYRLTDGVKLFARIENALNQQYEDAFSFASPGRAAFAGVRATF
ncbi:MAG TPA: TonB-dependent receptor [Alphaproteobacteria bacterium]|nr:TonB-dependent receptor [Alphaproteobacteria bacterium]